MANPNDQNVLSEEEIGKKETRLEELYEKDGKTEAEKEEIKSLKTEVKEARRIWHAEVANDAKIAKLRAKEAKDEAERFKTEKEELEKKSKVEKKAVVGERVVEINGKQFYTNEALQEMIEAGKITVTEANSQAEERDEEKRYIRFKERSRQEEQQESFLKSQQEDWEKVKKDYPQFDKNHPKFDPDDPLYKEANDLFVSGFRAHPQGFSKSVEKAKKILGIGREKPDVTDELSVPTGGSAATRGGYEDVKLTSYEEDMAKKQFCRGDVVNPKTNRPYTEDEAIAKALRNKKAMVEARGAKR